EHAEEVENGRNGNCRSRAAARCARGGRRMSALRRGSRQDRSRHAALAVGCAIALLMIGIAARAEDANGTGGEPSVTPYRPTVSDPADLSAPGWLEGEFGGLRTFGEDHSRSDSVPFLLKYAFDENHGILVGGNAYASIQPAGTPGHSGVGDVA